MAHIEITDEQIRDAAYQIWLDEGQPHGRDEAHWQQAFEALNAAPKAKAARKPVAKKAAPKTKTAPKKPAK
ncbi:MAG: DUF2934 domain-containing protein [Octadecabacter sp.]